MSEDLAQYRFETGIYRPPSEGGSNSLLIRLTRNCPWNRCAFCAMYKTEKFELRPVSEIKADIDAMSLISNELRQLSEKDGYTNCISRDAAVKFLNKHPELNYHPGFAMLFNWLASGGRTAFLQDADSLIMKTSDLVEVLQYLRSRFPSIQRVTSYARSRTLQHKKLSELLAIRQAGLDRLHVGLESGYDELLKYVKKGVTAEGHIKGGQKAIEAGFEVSEYWMPGLGGKDFSINHALETARVLNEINPHYIRCRPFYPLPGTPMYQAWQMGSFVMLSPEEQLYEIKLTIESLNVTGRVCFDHVGNYWKRPGGGLLFSHDYEGYKFPEEKQVVLELIDEGLMACNRRPRFLEL